MGIEPTSTRPQHIVLPLNYYHLQKEGIEPSPLMSKTNVIPFRLLLNDLDGIRTHINQNLNMACQPIASQGQYPWRDLNPHVLLKPQILSLLRLPFRHMGKNLQSLF